MTMSLFYKRTTLTEEVSSKRTAEVSGEEQKKEQDTLESDIGYLIVMILFMFALSLIPVGIAIKNELLVWTGVGLFWALVLGMWLTMRLADKLRNKNESSDE